MMAGLVTATEAQQVDVQVTTQSGPVMTSAVDVIESMPLESVTSVPNAPFSADAETEFTQLLGDGNRIERRYSSMMARDSQGRTRREEEIALVGPLAVDGPSPRLVTILDPVAGQSYTLDERQHIAYRNPMALAKLRGGHAYAYAHGPDDKGGQVWVREAEARAMLEANGQAKVTIAGVPGQKLIVGDAAASKITTESLRALVFARPADGGADLAKGSAERRLDLQAAQHRANRAAARPLYDSIRLPDPRRPTRWLPRPEEARRGESRARPEEIGRRGPGRSGRTGRRLSRRHVDAL
jgi:hypothetical protein